MPLHAANTTGSKLTGRRACHKAFAAGSIAKQAKLRPDKRNLLPCASAFKDVPVAGLAILAPLPLRREGSLVEDERALQLADESGAPAAGVGQHINQSGLNGLSHNGTVGLATGVFKVTSTQPISYVIEEVADLFGLNNQALLRGVEAGSFPSRLAASATKEAGQRRFIVMDDNVYRLYGAQVRQFFVANNIDFRILPLPTNEANKDFDLVFRIAAELEAFHLNRRKEPVIAIGGGVCLDVTGLAANLYRRNTPVIKVPTTLMAAIDASIGIKTAVNFEGRKNKLGTYCPPLAVFLDRAFLRTLDQRNLSNGSAEMLKMACVKDAELFVLLEGHAADLIASKYQGTAAGVAMRRSVQGMLEELEYNLWEHILCRLVDYGHAFSPEIEMAALASGNELLHGEAVNIDMALTTQIAFGRELIDREQRDRVFGVMRAMQLPFWHPVCSPGLFIKGLEDTTRARDGLQRVPLMRGIGDATFVDDITHIEIICAATVLRTIAEHVHNSPAPVLGSARNNIIPVAAREAPSIGLLVPC